MRGSIFLSSNDHMHAPSIQPLEPHSCPYPRRGWWYTSMVSGGSPVAEYELCLQARAERWGLLFGRTVRDLQKTRRTTQQGPSLLPLETLHLPISDLRIRTQEELVRVCLAICRDLKKFSTEHGLTQDIWVTYSPEALTRGKTKAEMCAGKKKITELKQRMKSLR